MRLLLLEDDKILGEGLSGYLRADGHHVDWFTLLSDAQAVINEPFDALLIDWQLPDGEGIEWVKKLRQQGCTTPALILSARDLLTDRIAGLDSGADDYLVKPFEPEELIARIRAVRRRVTAKGNPSIWLGQVEIDLNVRSVFREEARIDLTPREWSLLEALATRAGRIVSKSDLDALMMGFQGDAASNSLEVHIFNLRRKIGREVIETIRGIGYRVSQ